MGQTLKGIMYKMKVYDADGNMFRIEVANNKDYFERYKHKVNYRIEIIEMTPYGKEKEVIYSEVKR